MIIKLCSPLESRTRDPSILSRALVLEYLRVFICGYLREIPRLLLSSVFGTIEKGTSSVAARGGKLHAVFVVNVAGTELAGRFCRKSLAMKSSLIGRMVFYDRVRFRCGSLT